LESGQDKKVGYLLKGESSLSYETGDWYLYNREKDKSLVPRKSARGRLETDYLLITCIPNVLEEPSRHSNSKMLFLTGCHLAGLSAREIIFRHVGKLWEKTEGSTGYFQAAIKCKSIVHKKSLLTKNERWSRVLPEDTNIIKVLNLEQEGQTFVPI
jgi:hypothetical protein